MLARLTIELDIDEERDVPRLQEFLRDRRQMMLDPGGDERSFIGEFVNCEPVGE